MTSKLRAGLLQEWITPIDALHRFQCFSLSQRAGQLRREGYNVLDKWVKLPSGKRVKAYRIV